MNHLKRALGALILVSGLVRAQGEQEPTVTVIAPDARNPQGEVAFLPISARLIQYVRYLREQHEDLGSGRPVKLKQTAGVPGAAGLGYGLGSLRILQKRLEEYDAGALAPSIMAAPMSLNGAVFEYKFFHLLEWDPALRPLAYKIASIIRAMQLKAPSQQEKAKIDAAVAELKDELIQKALKAQNTMQPQAGDLALVEAMVDQLHQPEWIEPIASALAPQYTTQHTIEHGGAVLHVAWSPDGKRGATASMDGTVKLFDAKNPEQATTLTLDGGATSIAFSPDSSVLAVATAEGTLFAYDVNNPRDVHEFKQHTRHIHSIAFNHDGTRLISASQDGQSIIWDVPQKQTGGADPSQMQPQTVTQHQGEPWYVAFDSKGERAVTTTRKGEVRVHDPKTGTTLHQLPHGQRTVTSAAFDPQHRYLATSSSDGTIRVWNLKNGLPVSKFGGNGVLSHDEKEHIKGLEFSPDGNLLLTFSSGGGAYVWDVASGTLKYKLPHGDEWITSASFSDDGLEIATAATNDMVSLWSSQDGALLGVIKHGATLDQAHIHPSTGQIISGSWDNTGRISAPGTPLPFWQALYTALEQRGQLTPQ